MAESKVNGGSSYENQGDQTKSRPNPNTGKAAKQDAKKWKSKGMKNPSIPDWIG